MKRLSHIISTMVFVFMVSIAYIPHAKAADINVPDDYSTIQEAIDAAVDGDVVIVDPEKYYENINFLGKAITVRGTDPNDQDIVAATIIDANQVDHVVTLGENSVLTGVTVTGSVKKKSGIYSSNLSIISNCIITKNGIGIVCDKSNPTITNCTIIENSDIGIECYESKPTITDCTISKNAGSGIKCSSLYYFFSSSPKITNCIISENSDSGIICYRFSSPTITNCIITRNGAYGIYCRGEVIGGPYFDPAGMYFYDFDPFILCVPRPKIIDCTITENSAINSGGGIYSELSSPIVKNCIIWNNVPDEISVDIQPFGFGISYQNFDIGSGYLFMPRVSHSDVQWPRWKYPGIGNINADPLFVDPEAGDYRLQPGSPCIERGKRRCDMGAYGTYEYRVPRSRSGRYLRR